jgi:hypothetical protein
MSGWWGSDSAWWSAHNKRHPCTDLPPFLTWQSQRGSTLLRVAAVLK